MLLDSFRKESVFNPYVNTGTLFDYGTGRFRTGTNGLWVLDGGLSACLGISGRGQTYKSGVAGSLLARAMNIHPESEGYVFETEGTIADAERYDDFLPEGITVSDRIVFRNSNTCNLTAFMDDFGEIVKLKEKQKKDYLVESPFMDPKTMKPFKIYRPTFVLVDSFSRARSGAGDEKYDKNSIDDSNMNAVWLQEGNIKSRIMNDLPSRASKVGIYTIMTAHVGKKADLDPYNRDPKQLQYMTNNDKMKNVGSNFEFLTTALLQTLKATTLKNKDKSGSEFPFKHSTPMEVNQVDTMLVRCKNNAAGINIPFIVSQYQGILDSVTNFQYLRDKVNGNFGFNVKGNNEAFAPVLVPDTYLSKRNIRTVTQDNYTLNRALELLAQLCFIQKLWSTWNMPEYVHMKPEKMAEMLSNSKNLTVDRVLNSTGVWSTSKQDRERLTIMDILRILHDEK